MHRDADIVTAIPIEAIIPLAIPARSIHFEEDSQRLDEDQRRTQLASSHATHHRRSHLL